MHDNSDAFKTSFQYFIEKYGDIKISGSAFTVEERLIKLKDKRFSDITSEKNGEILQWVNYVQQGGGTLGISLVGYTTVLEYLGIRFLRVAGTSAGAINTLFLAAIGQKDDPKMPELYALMSDKSRFPLKKFVDTRSWILRKLIYSLGRGQGLVKNVLNLVLTLLILTPLIFLPILSHVSNEGLIIYMLGLIVFAIFSSVLLVAYLRFEKYNFGINSGNEFEKFLEKELKSYNILFQKDLDRKAKLDFQFSDNMIKDGDFFYSWSAMNDGDGLNKIRLKLRLKKEMLPKVFKNINTDYSFVTTDIHNECKVIFPSEADLYFENPEEIKPSWYVRCSMAIPFFFKAMVQPVKPKDLSIWETRKGIPKAQVEDQGVLVDGGTLSNFPINIFHDPKIREPRVPIFGVRIIDAKPTKEIHSKLTFGDYILKYLNTFRSNEDNSFLAINPFYKRFCISEIKVYEIKEKISWLDFNMTQEKQHLLFLKGVETALQFLEEFDWEIYKTERQKVWDYELQKI